MSAPTAGRPRVREDTRPEGRQRWRDLLFVHWPVAPGAVRSVVPDELPLDLYEGRAWVGVVAFEVRGARPPLLPGLLGLDFLETNARTYVHLPGDEPAVFFFSLDAASRLAVLAARLRYGLPYFHAEMDRRADGEDVRYRVDRRAGDGARLDVRYRTGDRRGPAPAGSLESFLVERRALHVVRGGAVRTVRVLHEPYPLREVEAKVAEETLLSAAGVQRPAAHPLLHFSDGVDVEIRVDR